MLLYSVMRKKQLRRYKMNISCQRDISEKEIYFLVRLGTLLLTGILKPDYNLSYRCVHLFKNLKQHLTILENLEKFYLHNYSSSTQLPT